MTTDQSDQANGRYRIVPQRNTQNLKREYRIPTNAKYSKLASSLSHIYINCVNSAVCPALATAPVPYRNVVMLMHIGTVHRPLVKYSLLCCVVVLPSWCRSELDSLSCVLCGKCRKYRERDIGL